MIVESADLEGLAPDAVHPCCGPLRGLAPIWLAQARQHSPDCQCSRLARPPARPHEAATAPPAGGTSLRAVPLDVLAFAEREDLAPDGSGAARKRPNRSTHAHPFSFSNSHKASCRPLHLAAHTTTLALPTPQRPATPSDPRPPLGARASIRAPRPLLRICLRQLQTSTTSPHPLSTRREGPPIPRAPDCRRQVPQRLLEIPLQGRFEVASSSLARPMHYKPSIRGTSRSTCAF